MRRAFTVAAAFSLVGSLWLSALCAAEPSAKLQLHVVDQIEFVTDHELTRERLEELASHVRDVEQSLHDQLKIPPLDGALRIYLFTKQAAFSEYVRQHIPSVGRSDTSGRHGIFLLRNGRPYIFLVATDQLVEALRHETVHALLNTSHPHLSIWLDEGLAQCFESPAGDHWHGRSFDVLSRDWLRRGPPRVKDLEQLRVMSQLTPRDYGGAWLAAYRLLNEEDGRRELVRHLEALRERRSDDSLATVIRHDRRLPNRPSSTPEN